MKFYHMTLLLLLFPALLLVIGLGCDRKSKEREWESFLLKYKDHDVLSVTESETWIEKHRDEIRIADNIEFGKPHIVSEFSGATIAVDPNDKRHVILTKERGEWELQRDEWESWLRRYKNVLGYDVLLSVTESEAWISKHREEISIPGNIEFGKPHAVYYATGLPPGVDGFAVAVDMNDKHRVLIRPGGNGGQPPPPPPIELKIGATYHPPNFIMIRSQNKVSRSYRNINGDVTHTVVFEAGGTVSGIDKETTQWTYTSEGGATIYFGTNNIVTKIVGAVHITKEKL